MRFRTAGRMWTDTQGNAALIFALSFMMVPCFIGGAIDFSAFVRKKATVQDALDEAALAAAISPSSDPSTPFEAGKYIDRFPFRLDFMF